MGDVTFISAFGGTALVIAAGYFAGISSTISEADRAGLGKFVGVISLPSLLFNQMATLKFRTINWTFMLTILMAKVVLFGLVAIGTLLFSTDHLGPDGSSSSRFIDAGINAIMVTQSNDFALGYPLLQSLYSNKEPSWVSLLFLMAPISLILLNPVGFFLILFGVNSPQSTTKSRIMVSNCQVFSNVFACCRNTDIPSPAQEPAVNNVSNTALGTFRQLIFRVITTPLVFWTLIGTLSNLCFGPGLPQTIDFVSGMVGNTFPPCALFLTGLAMGTKRKRPLDRKTLARSCALSTCKVFLMPVVNVFLLHLLNARDDMLAFGVIYGAIPTAPSVLVYAETYGLDIAPVALSLISCTILSAPVLLIAGSYAKGTSKLADEYSWVFQLNFPSLIGSAIVMISLLSNIKRRRRCKYRYFAQLAFAQFVQHTSLFTCINLENCSKLTYRIVYFFELLGASAAIFLTCSIALSFFVSITYGSDACARMEKTFTAFCWGISFILALVISLAAKQNTKYEPICAMMYPRAETYLLLLLDISAIVICIVSLCGVKKSIVEKSIVRSMSREKMLSELIEGVIDTDDLNYGLLDSPDANTYEYEENNVAASGSTNCINNLANIEVRGTNSSAMSNSNPSNDSNSDEASFHSNLGYRFIFLLSFQAFSFFVSSCRCIWNVVLIFSDKTDDDEKGLVNKRDILSIVDDMLKSAVGIVLILIFWLEVAHPVRSALAWLTQNRCTETEESNFSFSSRNRFL